MWEPRCQGYTASDQTRDIADAAVEEFHKAFQVNLDGPGITW